MKRLILFIILFFNIAPLWRDGELTLLQTEKTVAQNANVILRNYLRQHGTAGHWYETTTNGSQAQVIETDENGQFVAFHNIGQYSNDPDFIAYQYNTLNGSNNNSQDTDDEYYYDDGSSEFTKIKGEWIEATFDPMSVHWEWESGGFTQEGAIGPANCNDLLAGTIDNYWYGESVSEKNNIVTGSRMPALPCANRFLIGNKILHFTTEQQAMIKSYNFDGSTLVSVTDVNGNVYGNVVEHTDYTQQLISISNVAGCNGLEQKKTVLLTGQTTYKFVCFRKVDAHFAELNAEYSIERLTALTPSGNQKTVFKNIPDNLDGYAFTVPVTNLENAVVGSVVLGRTKAGAYYCETLLREDIERGAELHRDTKYIPEDINLHLDHPVNLPRWVRNFLEIFPNLVLGPCTIDYVNTKLEELHQSPGYATEANEDKRKKMEYQSLGYDLLFGYLYCATDESSARGGNCATQAGFGMLHELIATVDVAAMRDGIVKMVQGFGGLIGDNVKNLLDGIKEAVRQQVNTGIVNHDQLATEFVAKNISTNNAVWNKVKKIADAFRKMYFTDCGQFNFPGGGQGDICCYRNGQLAMMAIPLVLTAGDYAVMKLSGLAAKYGQRAAKAVEIIASAEDAGKVILTEVDAVMAAEKVVIREADGSVIATIKKEEDLIEGGQAIDRQIVITEAQGIIDNNILANLASELPNPTFVSKGKFHKSAHKIDPLADNALKSKVDDIIANGDGLGTKTEQIQDILFHDKAGYTILDGKYGTNNGIDGLYIKGTVNNPTEILAGEAKQWGSSGGGVALNAGNDLTGLPIQMSNDWIGYVARKLKVTGNPEKVAIGDMLLNPANASLIKKYITVVNKSTGDINILKLGTF